jgi:hypothetical protein
MVVGKLCDWKDGAEEENFELLRDRNFVYPGPLNVTEQAGGL